MKRRLRFGGIAVVAVTVLAVATPTFARTASGDWGSVGGSATATTVRPTTTVGPLRGEEDAVAGAQGVCSGDSEYDLGLGLETGIDLEFGLETGVPDQAWMVRMHYDSHIVVHMKVITDEDGGFEVRHVDANLPGRDTMHVVATNDRTGERCDGSIQAEV
jgi:hypothetical protein